jgi:hypothetical protein
MRDTVIFVVIFSLIIAAVFALFLWGASLNELRLVLRLERVPCLPQ